VLRGETLATGAPHRCSYCGGAVTFTVFRDVDGYEDEGYSVGTRCLRCTRRHTRESGFYATEAEAEEAMYAGSYAA